MLLTAMFIIATCTFEYEGDKEEEPSPAGMGSIADWTIELGQDNNYAGELTIEEATAQLADGTTGTVMRVGWASDTNLRMCEFWALLPEGFDYGEYNGVIFDVKINVSHNFMIALRNPPNTFVNTTSGTAWRLAQPQVYYNSLWQIITAPFDEAEQPGWGTLAPQGDIKEWLTDDKDNPSRKMLNINPQLNTGFFPAYHPPASSLPNGNAVNTVYTDDYKRIGFYKGDEPVDRENLDEDNICWVWVF